MQFLHQNADFTFSHFLVTFYQIWYLSFFMSVGRDVKWWFVSWIRISVALNKLFLWSLKNCKLARNAKETSKYQNGLWKNSASNFRCYRYSNKWKVHFFNTRFILPIEFFVLYDHFMSYLGVFHIASASEIFYWLTVCMCIYLTSIYYYS